MSLITFEGLDKSGKSTLINATYQQLLHQNVNVIVTNDPGGTKFGQKIKRDICTREMTILEELDLFTKARQVLLQQVIYPALSQGKLVLCDRYYDSTFAYQGNEENVTTELVTKCIENFIEPTLTFLLDCNISVCEARLKCADRIEKKGRNYFERVRQRYLEMAKSNRFVILDATSSVETNVKIVVETIRKLYSKTQ